MKKLEALKKPFLFTLCMLPVAVVGGWFTAEYSLANLDEDLLEQALAQGGSRELLLISSLISIIIYVVICSFFGYIVAEKLGLIKPLRFTKKETLTALLWGAAAGLVLCADAFTFAKWIPELKDYYAAAGSFDTVTWISAILYGGIIEEVMMRLFFMSLIALIIRKLFCRKAETVPEKVLIIANIIAAALFAAGHLPSTANMFGSLTPMLILRCFLLNGSFGLVFGWLYRKYGLQYAMAAHMLTHIVSKTIWFIVL